MDRKKKVYVDGPGRKGKPPARLRPEDGAPPPRLRRAERILRDRTGDLAILLEGPSDPGNLSATLRTAEALGIQNVHVVRRDRWHIRRKVTQRAERWLTLHRWNELAPALAVLRSERYRVLLACLEPGAERLDRVDAGGRLVVAFGNESAGASRELTEAADGHFWIPTHGFTGSLNLSVSVAISLWDIRGRQVAGRGEAGDLSEETRAALRERWYRSLAKGRADRVRDYLSWIGRVAADEEEGPPPDRRSS
jgi:tRNA (guanosine-2'-O-)-methyltransferase